jgi:hypothetical protein
MTQSNANNRISINNKIIVQAYTPGALRQEIKGGIARPGQRDGFVGLKVLVATKLQDGTEVPVGSIAYFKEEELYTQPWAKQKIKAENFLPEEFIIAELYKVDSIEILK